MENAMKTGIVYRFIGVHLYTLPRFYGTSFCIQEILNIDLGIRQTGVAFRGLGKVQVSGLRLKVGASGLGFRV